MHFSQLAAPINKTPFHVVQRGKLRCFRVRLKEAEEEEFHRVDMENRIKNLLSLKNNIESNKVYLCQYNSSAHMIVNRPELLFSFDERI